MSSQFPNFSSEYYGPTEDTTGAQGDQYELRPTPTILSSHLAPQTWNRLRSMINSDNSAYLTKVDHIDPDHSFAVSDAAGSTMEVCQPSPVRAYRPQSFLEQAELEVENPAVALGNATGGVVQTMSLVGQSAQMPLDLEDEGGTVRPAQQYTTLPIGLPTGKYSFICTPGPVLTRHIRTMPVWQPLPASQENATSGSITPGQNDQGLGAVKQIEIPDILAIMMAMSLAERKLFQVKKYGFDDLLVDLPIFEGKIMKSFEPNEEEVDCPYGCHRMKVERMRYHLEGVHLPGKPTNCNLCPRKYAGYRALLDHVEGLHCNWTFTCRLCGRNTPRRGMIEHFRFRCKGIWPPLPNGKKIGTQ
ncbi:hypothetical protein BDN72DRAFT_861565 [Pluteus cervinus]|uniref:Uncharacterized protein n=1 Tax=Pluteus cervinus TaxID=181527 RepID=A0ACD3AE30_9AGAR|nr:hypothetical protein BDN72DRAFT_861565 [Pluteus cervinus]